MAKHKINPKTLKDFRTKSGLSQEKLAEISGISKKTIARIEGGKSSANTNTLTKLAKTLNISPENLSNPSDFKESLLLGYQTVKLTLPENLLLALNMVEKCYGISSSMQLRLAPLFSALLIEESLAWRKQKVEEAEESFNKFKETYKHLPTVIPEYKIEESLMAEKKSIEQRDFFGKTDLLDFFSNQYHLDNDGEDGLYSICRNGDEAFCGRFQQYLKFLVSKVDTDIIQMHGEDSENPFVINSLEWIDYTINSSELEDITDGDFYAQKSLQGRYTALEDIPEDLLGKEARDKRIEWLENRIPQERRNTFENFVKSLDIDLGINQQTNEGIEQ